MAPKKKAAAKRKPKAKKIPGKRSVGRPRKDLTEENLQQMETLAAQGMSAINIARVLGMGSSTMYRRLEEKREFWDILETGRAKGIAQVSGAVFTAAIGGNMTAAMKYLESRDPDQWRPVQQIESQISGNMNIYSKMEEGELDAVIKSHQAAIDDS